MRRGWGLVLIAAAVSTVGLAACGDDDDDTLTAEQLATQGNAICEETNGKTDELFADFEGEEPSLQDFQAKIPGLIEILDDAIADFRALDAPEDLADDLEAATGDAEALRDEFEAAADDDAKLESLLSGEDPFTSVNEQLAELGITACTEE